MKKTFLVIVTLLISVSFVYPALAYRPYISTSAQVDEPGEWWLQMGVFDISKEGADSTITTPSVDLSYGFMPRFDAGLTGNLQVYTSGNSRNVELTGTTVYLDYQIKNGVMQGDKGPSVMAELNLLLPQTVRGQRDVGLNGILAASGDFFKFGYHVNTAFNFDQIDFNPGVVWGAIVEYPFNGKFRIGVEFTGTTTYTQPPDNIAGIGCIWELGPFHLDFGARMGLSKSANDWTITTGVSFDL